MLPDTVAHTKEGRLAAALADWEQARLRGQPVERDAFLGRYPDLANELAPLLDGCQTVAAATLPSSRTISPPDVPRLAEYEDLVEIGRGGMGVVYKARQLGTGKMVAIKILNPGWIDRLDAASRAEAIELLRTEARAAASLKHPCTIAVLHPGEYEGRPYLAMELIEGESLATLLTRQPNGRLADYDAARYLAGVAEAVHEAHQQDILHRDLKPGNILIDDRDQARVADFGLAKLERADGNRHEYRLLGTLPYMSPEQAADAEAVTPASDVYSLGATLYELLTGRPPFQGATFREVLDQLRDARPVAPSVLNPNVSRRLEGICLRCLEKNPRDRFASAGELAAALKGYLDEKATGWRLAVLGDLFIALGPVVFLINLTVYYLLRTDFAEPVVWGVLFSMYPALFTTFLVAPATRRDLDNYATRKELWFVWGAKLFTAVTIAVVLRQTLDLPARRTVELCYPIFAALSAMAVFIMTRAFRGPIYLLAVAGWLVALGMLPWLDYAPLIYGAYSAGGLVLFGLYERRLGRELS